MAGLEDGADAPVAELVQDQVVADQKASALVLTESGRLMTGEFAGGHQAARKAGNTRGEESTESAVSSAALARPRSETAHANSSSETLIERFATPCPRGGRPPPLLRGPPA